MKKNGILSHVAKKSIDIAFSKTSFVVSQYSKIKARFQKVANSALEKNPGSCAKKVLGLIAD